MLYLEMFSLAVVLQVLAGGEDAEAVLTSNAGVASVCWAHVAPKMFSHCVRFITQLTVKRPVTFKGWLWFDTTKWTPIFYNAASKFLLLRRDDQAKISLQDHLRVQREQLCCMNKVVYESRRIPVGAYLSWTWWYPSLEWTLTWFDKFPLETNDFSQTGHVKRRTASFLPTTLRVPPPMWRLWTKSHEIRHRTTTEKLHRQLGLIVQYCDKLYWNLS